MRAQGADEAIDYSKPDWSDRVLAALGGDAPAVVLDGVGGEIGRAAFAITADGGEFSAHGAASGNFAPLDQDAARERDIAVRGISDVQFSPEDGSRPLREALAEAAAGRVAPVMGRTCPLEDAAEAQPAHRGARGHRQSLLLVNRKSGG